MIQLKSIEDSQANAKLKLKLPHPGRYEDITQEVAGSIPTASTGFESYHQIHS